MQNGCSRHCTRISPLHLNWPDGGKLNQRNKNQIKVSIPFDTNKTQQFCLHSSPTPPFLSVGSGQIRFHTSPSPPNMSSNPPTDGLRRRPSHPSTQQPSRKGPEKPSTSSDSDLAAPSTPPSDATFECNVCFETPRDPVVTPCGHLYCWSCLYRWMRLHSDSPQCPVCKSAVDKRHVIPIYGRGRVEHRDPREPAPADEDLPPRPAGHRAQPAQPQGLHHGPAFGMHHATFGRINPYGAGAGYENVSLSTFGLFPSLFGFQIAYPRVNDPPREEAPANQEDGMSELSTFCVSALASMLSFVEVSWFCQAIEVQS